MKFKYSYHEGEAKLEYKDCVFTDKSKIGTTVFLERFRLDNFAARVLSAYKKDKNFRNEVDRTFDSFPQQEVGEFVLSMRLSDIALEFLAEYLEPHELGLPEEGDGEEIDAE